MPNFEGKSKSITRASYPVAFDENNQKLKKELSVNLLKALDMISLVEDKMTIKLKDTLKIINFTDL